MKKYRVVEGKPIWFTIKALKVLMIALSFVAAGSIPLFAGIMMGN